MFLDIHSHRFVSDTELRVLRSYFAHEDPCTDQPFTMGVHPWNLNSRPLDSDFARVEKFAVHPKLIAVGETGLDRAIGTSFEIQKNWFLAHLNLAEQVKKPVIIHCVRAYSDLLQIRKNGRFHQPWIIHGFNENSRIVRDLVLAGCYLSVGPQILREASKVTSALPAIPSERLFFETDDSDAGIRTVYQQASKITGQPVGVLKEITLANYRTVFKETL